MSVSNIIHLSFGEKPQRAFSNRTPEPTQGSVLQQTGEIWLERIDQDNNVKRQYVVRLERDFLDGWKVHGRNGRKGHGRQLSRSHICIDQETAFFVFQQVVALRKRRGYHIVEDMLSPAPPEPRMLPAQLRPFLDIRIMDILGPHKLLKSIAQRLHRAGRVFMGQLVSLRADELSAFLPDTIVRPIQRCLSSKMEAGQVAHDEAEEVNLTFNLIEVVERLQDIVRILQDMELHLNARVGRWTPPEFVESRPALSKRLDLSRPETKAQPEHADAELPFVYPLRVRKI